MHGPLVVGKPYFTYGVSDYVLQLFPDLNQPNYKIIITDDTKKTKRKVRYEGGWSYFLFVPYWDDKRVKIEEEFEWHILQLDIYVKTPGGFVLKGHETRKTDPVVVKETSRYDANPQSHSNKSYWEERAEEKRQEAIASKRVLDQSVQQEPANKGDEALTGSEPAISSEDTFTVDLFAADVTDNAQTDLNLIKSVSVNNGFFSTLSRGIVPDGTYSLSELQTSANTGRLKDSTTGEYLPAGDYQFVFINVNGRNQPDFTPLGQPRRYMNSGSKVYTPILPYSKVRIIVKKLRN